MMSAYADVPVPKVDPAERLPSPETGPPSCAELAEALIGASGKLEAELGMLGTALTFNMGHYVFLYLLLSFTPSCWPIKCSLLFFSAVAAEKAGREKAERERDQAGLELDRVRSELRQAGVDLERMKSEAGAHSTEMERVKSEANEELSRVASKASMELNNVQLQLDQARLELDRVRSERDEETSSEFQNQPGGLYDTSFSPLHIDLPVG